MKLQHLFWLFGMHWRLEFHWFLKHQNMSSIDIKTTLKKYTKKTYYTEFLMHIPIGEWKEYVRSDNYKKYVQL